jgi:hypothetical protein
MQKHFRLDNEVSEGEVSIMFNNVAQKLINDAFESCLLQICYYIRISRTACASTHLVYCAHCEHSFTSLADLLSHSAKRTSPFRSMQNQRILSPACVSRELRPRDA